MKLSTNLKFEDLTEVQPLTTKTSVERADPATWTEEQRQFLSDGILVLKDFLPAELIDNYCQTRSQLPKDRNVRSNFWSGWFYPTPYMEHESLRDLALYAPLMDMLKLVIGEEMGLHLTLTGWVSTERNFHQDTYLNPSDLWSYYVAVWMALDDIHPDSGPFELVRGSHKWDVMRREKLFAYLTPEEQVSPDWPTFTQKIVAKICEQEIERRGGIIEQYVPKKGDVLIWHSNLMHRGSLPNNPDLLRKSLICHYSSIKRRADMKEIARHTNGKHYFALSTRDSNAQKSNPLMQLARRAKRRFRRIVERSPAS